jgi:hypothetical protein
MARLSVELLHRYYQKISHFTVSVLRIFQDELHRRTIIGSAGGVLAGFLISFAIATHLTTPCSPIGSIIHSIRLVPKAFALDPQQCKAPAPGELEKAQAEEENALNLIQAVSEESVNAPWSTVAKWRGNAQLWWQFQRAGIGHRYNSFEKRLESSANPSVANQNTRLLIQKLIIL